MSESSASTAWSPAGSEPAHIRYNAADPTGTVAQRRAFQEEVTERWTSTMDAVDGWLDSLADSPNHDRLLLRFQDMFRSTALNEVLSRMGDEEINRGQHWTGTYIQRAYQHGLSLARNDLDVLGEYSSRAIQQATRQHNNAHQQAIRTEYGLAYTGLYNNVNDALKELTDVVRTAADTRQSREWLRDELNSRIEKHPINNARSHANVTVIRSVNEALLTSYEQVGVENVGAAVESSGGKPRQNMMRLNAEPETFAEVVKGEVPDADDPSSPDRMQFVTAGDDDVCAQCRALEGITVSIAEARGTEGKLAGASAGAVLPAHPNCRCRWLPLPAS